MGSHIPENLVSVDGQRINVASIKAGIAGAVDQLKAGRGFSFLTLNLDHLVNRRANQRFSDIYARSTFVSADGQPVVTLARRSGATIERTTGADIVLPLCGAASGIGVSVYLFGSDSQTLKDCAQKMTSMHPRLNIAGLEAPAMGFDPDSDEALECAERINKSGATLCLVALPTVKAAYAIDRYAGLFPHIGFVGIGAALDFIVGKQSRAPKIMRNNGLEWFWRLAMSPRTMLKRYVNCGILYLRLRLSGTQGARGLS